MNTELVPDFQIDTAQQLAEYLSQAETWSEIERLTAAFAHFKVEAWNLLQEEEQKRILKIKDWKDSEVAQLFPLGSTVQRRDDPEKKQGVVTDYWQAYGVEYVTFSVNGFTDWCQGKSLKRIYSAN